MSKIMYMDEEYAGVLPYRIKSETVTTGVTGNINLGLSASDYHVISAESAGYMALPFVNGTTWFLKIRDYESMNTVNSTSVTYKMVYILA